MSVDLAVDIFRRQNSSLKTDEDEDQAPEGEIVPESVNYWFVGAAWDDGDQRPRFLSEDIRQNGYDDKFSYLVRQMKQGIGSQSRRPIPESEKRLFLMSSAPSW